jgi:hypothetical protein
VAEALERHTGIAVDHLILDKAPPVIDFSRCMVIAVIRGSTRGGVGEELESTVREADLIRFRFHTTWYQSGGGGHGEERPETQDFGFFIVPREVKAIVLEEASLERKGGTPTYTERSRFDALPESSVVPMDWPAK